MEGEERTMNETRKHLEGALYHLKEKLKVANTPELVERITDCMLEIAAFLNQTKEEN